MTLRSTVVTGVYVVLFVVAALLLLGAVFGQPVLLSYVETGSMSPTLEPGDGFVAVPTALDSSVEAGDVIVFDAEEIDDGGLVTHRVVEVTDQGYITQGDANPVTDQDGGEPPVQDGQVYARALTLNGNVVAIPRLGTPVEIAGSLVSSVQQRLAILFGTRTLLGTQGLAYLLIAFGAITYVLAAGAERLRTSTDSRSSARRTGAIAPGPVIAGMTVLLLLVTTAAMVVPAGPYDLTSVSSQTPSDRADVIERGTTQNATYTTSSSGPLPTVSVVETRTDGIEVDANHAYVEGRSEATYNLTIRAPDETGPFVETVHEYRYLALLPQETILSLHAVHPWLPILAINILVGSTFLVVSLLLVGLDPVRLTRHPREIPTAVRLRRRLR